MIKGSEYLIDYKDQECCLQNIFHINNDSIFQTKNHRSISSKGISLVGKKIVQPNVYQTKQQGKVESKKPITLMKLNVSLKNPQILHKKTQLTYKQTKENCHLKPIFNKNIQSYQHSTIKNSKNSMTTMKFPSNINVINLIPQYQQIQFKIVESKILKNEIKKSKIIQNPQKQQITQNNMKLQIMNMGDIREVMSEYDHSQYINKDQQQYSQLESNDQSLLKRINGPLLYNKYF